MKIKTQESVMGYLFALPSMAGFALFFVIPFIGSLYYCFTRGITEVEFVGLKNFSELLQSGSFLLAARNTFVFNMISVPLITFVSLLLALLLNRKLKGLAYFRMIFIMPLVVPIASVILVWQITFGEMGALNGMLHAYGITPVEWMRSGWSVWVLVLVYIWKNCGYNIVLFLAGLNSIPVEYYETACIDGANYVYRLFKITLPFLVPTGFFVFIISIINSFKVFREAYLLAGSYPYRDIYMLQHFMNNNFFNLSYQRLTTAAFLMAVVIFLLVLVLFRFESKFGKSLG